MRTGLVGITALAFILCVPTSFASTGTLGGRANVSQSHEVQKPAATFALSREMKQWERRRERREAREKCLENASPEKRAEIKRQKRTKAQRNLEGGKRQRLACS